MSNLRGRLARIARLTGSRPTDVPLPTVLDVGTATECVTARLDGVVGPLDYSDGLNELQRYEADWLCGLIFAWAAGDVSRWELREDLQGNSITTRPSCWLRLQDVPIRFPEWAPFRDLYLKYRAMSDADLVRLIEDLRAQQ